MRKIFLLIIFILFCSSSLFADILSITSNAQQGYITNLDSLTTASTSTDTLRLVSNYINKFSVISFSIQVAGINADSTYQNTVIRIVGGQVYNKLGNLNSDGTDITLSTNGVYNFNYSYAGTTEYFAILLISKAGGTPKLYMTVKAG